MKKLTLNHFYDVESSIIEKLNTIVKEMYGADGIVVEKSAMKQIKSLKKLVLINYQYVWLNPILIFRWSNINGSS